VASALAATHPLNRFSAGQVSPLLDARTDSEFYKSGLRQLENMVPRVVGDVSKRPGTVFVDDFLVGTEFIVPGGSTYYQASFVSGDSSNPLAVEDAVTSAGSGSTNDFSDANSIAVFNYETANLGYDSKLLNDMSNFGPVTQDADSKQGSWSGVGTGASYYLARSDVNLTAGFPLKSSGGSMVYTICTWVKFSELPGSGGWQAIMSKYDNRIRERGVLLTVHDSGLFTFGLGYNNSDNIDFGGTYVLNPGTQPAVAINTWYHIALTVDSNSNIARIIGYFSDVDTTYDSGNIAILNPHTPGTERWEIMGASQVTSSYNMRGRVDETVFFDKVLTPAEIADVRTGNYGAAAATAVVKDITYLTSTTGVITWELDGGSAQFRADQVISNGVDSVTISGAITERDSTYSYAPILRALPFVFSQDDAYILVFEPNNIAFCRTVGGISGSIQAP
jgi:hypothetical protein